MNLEEEKGDKKNHISGRGNKVTLQEDDDLADSIAKLTQRLNKFNQGSPRARNF